VDTLVRDVFVVVDDVPVIMLHTSVGWQAVGPDLSQRLGEVVCFLDNWPKVIFIVASFLS
jgi:hypothetical protein